MSADIALLVIDVQQALVEGAYQEREVLDRIGALLAAARAASVPVIYLQHEENEASGPLNRGAAGWQIHAAVTPCEGELVIAKRACDSFYETPLQNELDARGIKRIVVTGLMTEYCVDTTCRQATSLGYDVTLVEDAHTTGGNEIMTAAQTIAHHNAVLADLAQPDHPITVRPAAEITF
jgi:nicotinamidase-related amidase